MAGLWEDLLRRGGGTASRVTPAAVLMPWWVFLSSCHSPVSLCVLIHMWRALLVTLRGAEGLEASWCCLLPHTPTPPIGRSANGKESILMMFAQRALDCRRIF